MKIHIKTVQYGMAKVVYVIAKNNRGRVVDGNLLPHHNILESAAIVSRFCRDVFRRYPCNTRFKASLSQYVDVTEILKEVHGTQKAT